MALKDIAVRNAKPAERPYKMADGGGLYLLVNPNGSKWWRLKYRYGGKEKLLALGVYPEVSLSDARTERDKARHLLRIEHIDPGSVRKTRKREAKSRTENSFAALAEAWFENKKAGWSESSATKARQYLDSDLIPALGTRPIAEIRRPELVDVLRRLEKRGAYDAARKCRGWLSNIFRYALVAGVIESNPATDLDVIAAQVPQRKHHPHIALAELPGLLKAMDAFGGSPEVLSALRMLMLTAVRPGEVRGATWDEFDLDAAIWSIPAERMKMRRPHIVPLPSQAVEIVRAMKMLTGKCALVFPSPQKPRVAMSENTMNKALAVMGYKGRQTGHGFRHLISTALNERGYNSDWIERQLAHGDENKIRAVYDKAEYLDQRCQMMQEWADYLDALHFG
ncbi:MAG: tyrosine-type recombinase/integrase [Sinimarinibacterium flocculans]|uniref:tyrosine-type recombinase/integrase n=1 Tax=Sinimarinibacterium flocculans TaxID=985250 RepID=UPI003C43D0CD